MLYFFVVWNALRYFVCYIFSACGTRYGIVESNVIYFLLVLCSCCMREGTQKKLKQKTKMMCCIFSRVDCALVFCIVFFCLWNALWYFVLYFNVCGMRSVFFCYIFPRVERTLVFYVIFFYVWNGIWYFVLYFIRVKKRSGILCYIF